MSKREKNIEILEVEKIVDNNTITELTTKDQEVIGRILQDEKRYIAELKMVKLLESVHKLKQWKFY